MPTVRRPTALRWRGFETQILRLIEQGARSIDLITTTLAVPPSELLQAITMMELKGLIKAEAGYLYAVG